MILNRHALTEFREARALTKRELAALAAISPSYLTELENGTKPGGPKVLRKLADALAVKPLALMGNGTKDAA